jgi:glycosidase
MTGDKPDPRLRTPMQWSPGPGLGFTSGTPWERPQANWLTTTVAAQDADPGSLLNLYRRLIHLRRDHEALATGSLVPLSAGSGHVAAYLRRSGEHAVLVVANLGDEAAAAVAISSAAGALAPGRYAARDLLDGTDGAPLVVSDDGRIEGYLPIPRPIAARESLVLNLIRQ